jgi:pyruvate dehydrogenase E2 component (dihydrolipoamide acetyltransferase)
VDISNVGGSGAGGRISVEDVKSYARALNAGLLQGAGRATQPPLPDFSKWGEVERQPLTALRQAAAEHMANCWSTIPHVTLHDKADITDLEKLRQENKGKSEAAGAKLTITAFVIKITASALKAFPKFNSSLDWAGREMVVRKYFHIGVAMDTEKGLIVPVLRDVDKKNVLQVAAELAQLSEKARAGKVALADMQGSCISVTNLGGIGCGFFTPIVNFPEVAILGVGKAVLEPVMVNGFFQPRLTMPLSLSFDHRVVDGADGARFMQWVINAIQKPVLLSLEG